MSHTPTPWTFVPEETLSHDAPGWRQVLVPGGILGAPDEEGNPQWVVALPDLENPTDAAHIVHCVNLHGEFVAALATLEREATAFEDTSADERFNGNLLDALDLARAILAKAKAP